MHELTTAQRTSYLRQLLQHTGTLSLPLGSGLSFSLVQVFQPLRLRQSSRDAQETLAHEEESPPADEEEQNEHSEPVPPQQVLAENGLDALSQSPQGRLVILGGPGSGKTTVLKHLVYHHTRQALENPDAALPLFLSLPDLVRSGQDLPAYLAQQAADLGLERNAGQAFVQAIEQGQAFVCLDSLDEVLPRQRAGIIRQINSLAHRPGNIWIVGSRFTDYKGGQFEPGRFQEWELQPLDMSRRLHLAAHLLPTIQRQLSPHASETHSLDPGAYVRALEEHRQAANWSENPLLFSLAAVVYLRQGTLSGSRSLLYREVIDAVLETRQPDPSQRSHLRALLAEVALELYQRKGRTFHTSDLRATLRTINREQHATWSIESTLTALLNSGVLDVVSFETYSFRHQTFQEYLVASALASRFMSDDEQVRVAGEQFAWSKHTYSRWHEIQRLLAGILVQEYGAAGVTCARAWLERLLRQHEHPEGDPGYLSLELALKLLGEVAQLEAWQAAETLALEEKGAEVWLQLATLPSTVQRGRDRHPYKQRMWTLAPEIGSFRPTAQVKTIDKMISMLYEHTEFAALLGRTRSRAAAERLLAAWQAHPDEWIHLSKPFGEGLQEYAPIDPVLHVLRNEKDDRELGAAISFFEGLGSRIPVLALMDLLRHPWTQNRQAAADILIAGASMVEIPVDSLLLLCHSGQPGAFEAALVLAHLRRSEGLELLLGCLPEASYPPRQRILCALVNLGSKVPLEALVLCLQSSEDQVRTQALTILATIGQQIPAELLHEALHYYHEKGRCATIKALRSTETLATLPHLLLALQDPAEEVVAEALRVFLALVEREPITAMFPFLKETDESATSPSFSLSDSGLVANAELGKALVTFYMSDAVQPSQSSGWGFQKRKDRDEFPQDVFKVIAYLAQILTPSMVVASLYQAVDEFRIRTTQPAVEHDKGSTLLSWLEESCQHCWQVREVAARILAQSGAKDHLSPLLAALGSEESNVYWMVRYTLLQVVDAIPLEALLNLLKHPLPNTRRCALDLLAAHHKRPALEPLLAALHDSYSQVRAAAANVFAGWQDQAPLEALIEATGDVDVEVRVAAACALGKSGQRDPALAQSGILRVLSHRVVGDPDKLQALGAALRMISPHAPSEPLLQTMCELVERKKNWQARFVAEALAAQGERMPVTELCKMLAGEDRTLRWLALTALGGAGAIAPIDEIIRLLDDEDARYSAIDALNTLWRHVSAEIFLRILREEQRNAQGSPQSVFALIHKGERLPFDLLIWAFPRADFRECQALVAYLVTLDELPSAFMSELISGLAHAIVGSPADYRFHFKKKVFQELLSRFPLALLQSALKHPRAKVRQGVLRLLRLHPEEIAQETVIVLLSDPSTEVRRVALQCLRTHSQSIPVTVLLPLLRDKVLRKEVIIALGETGADAPIEKLLPFFESSDAFVQFVVVRALRQPGVLERIPVTFFLHATGDAHDGVRHEALKALKDKDQQQAITCCLDALGECMPRYGVSGPLALQILQEIHPAILPEIVQEATSVLYGGPAGRFLRPVVLSSLAEAIGDLASPSPEGLARLEQLLDYPHWEVRMKAAQALGTLRRNIPDDTIRRLLELRRDPRSRAVREAADEALAEILSLETGIEDD